MIRKGGNEFWLAIADLDLQKKKKNGGFVLKQMELLYTHHLQFANNDSCNIATSNK